MVSERNHERCFYCGALVRENVERDHFPFSRLAGGTDTVPCCISCHDMKDRFALKDWPLEWWKVVALDLPRLNRETRIFIAKALRVIYDTVTEDERKRNAVETRRSRRTN